MLKWRGNAAKSGGEKREKERARESESESERKNDCKARAIFIKNHERMTACC